MRILGIIYGTIVFPTLQRRTANRKSIRKYYKYLRKQPSLSHSRRARDRVCFGYVRRAVTNSVGRSTRARGARARRACRAKIIICFHCMVVRGTCEIHIYFFIFFYFNLSHKTASTNDIHVFEPSARFVTNSLLSISTRNVPPARPRVTKSTYS